MDPQSDLRRLKRERNVAAVSAVLIVVVGMAIAVPHALERRRRLHAANDELLSLQATIGYTQEQIRGVQAQIVRAQSEIRSLVHERR